MRLKCFTSIELLVVIAVLAILAALLLPALNQAKVKADSAVCRNNLRQEMLAVTLYVQQYSSYPSIDDLIPDLKPYLRQDWPSGNYDESDPTAPRYLGPRDSVYACPAYNRLRGEFALLPIVPPMPLSGSYAYNAVGNNGIGLGPPNIPGTTRHQPARENQVLSPSDLFGIGEATLRQLSGPSSAVGGVPEYWDLFDQIDYLQAVLSGTSISFWDFQLSAQAMRQRHNGRWNVGFCDDHVETLTATTLFGVSNSAVAQRWNIDHQAHNEFWAMPPKP
jgi:type II secretory pathway pseudopilin PulG